MTKFHLTLAFLLLATAAFGLASAARGDDLGVTVYTPGYFIDQASWDKETAYIYRYYRSFAKETGIDPCINPYLPSGLRLLSSTFTVANNGTTSAGRYVSLWNAYVHSESHSYKTPKLSLSGYPKTITLTSSMLSGSSAVDLIPCLAMMSYTLTYDKNGGTWISEPSAQELIWSNQVTFAVATCVKRNGYDYQGWNTAKDGTGLDVTPGQTAEGGLTLEIDNGCVDANGHTNVTLYAQWQVKSYDLHLRLGAGIQAIYYKVNGATSWTKLTEDADVPVDYDTTWYAYAEPMDGYTYTEFSEAKPKSDTIQLDSSGETVVGGEEYNPVAKGQAIEVVFFGNGETSGSTASQQFTVGTPKSLSKNGFVRNYRVEFDSNGGSAVKDKESQSYKFLEWKDSSGMYSYSDQQEVTNPCDSTGERVELYAQWSKDEAAFPLPTTERTGYAFGGWYGDYACEKDFIGMAGDSFTPTCNTNLYAKWTTETYTVTFRDGHKDAGDALIEEQQVEYNHSATPPTPPTHKYSNFTEWTGGDYTHVTGNMTIRAQYADKVYQVYYQSNYRDGSAEDSYTSTKCGPGESTDEITLKTAKSIGFSKLGYAFSGWDWDPDAETPEWQANDTMTYKVIDNHPDAKLYAIWAPNSYTVQFDGNGATGGETKSQAFTYDEPQALTANGFSYAGQDFLGWATSSGDAAARRVTYADKQVVSNLTTTAGETVTLTAVWSCYHFVRFDRNGATNETEMALQTFSGAETNALSANVYGKVGYTFAGWATNTGDAAACRVAYTNCQSASFPLAQPNETNILYAVWTTNRYTIVFDPGTNLKSPYFFGEMAPLTNCAYDTVVTIKCGYTNYCSQGLLGWSRTKGASKPEFTVKEKMWERDLALAPRVTGLGGDAVVSNVTAAANGTNTLYAVWADEGEMSKAAGLANAVLYETQFSGTTHWGPATQSTQLWDTNHEVRVACTNSSSTADIGTRELSLKVRGSGTLRFSWCSRLSTANSASFVVRVGTAQVTNLFQAAKQKRNWNYPVELKIAGDEEHVVSWILTSTLVQADVIAIDDVAWTPGVEVKPGEEPTYETKEAAEAAAANARVVRPNAEVEGVVTAEAYNEMFQVSAVQTSFAPAAEQWTLVANLKPAVSNEVQAVLDAAETSLCSVITNNPISVAFEMKAGLYYGLAATNEVRYLPLAVPATWVLGDGGEKSVEASRPPAAAMMFYELRAAVLPQ